MSNNRVTDHQARDQALDCSRSFIIQAPAGSGKTELLTQRVLALLAIVDQPEEILAITFTRKAASEMSERIIKALELASTRQAKPETEPAATTWALGLKVLQQNNRLKWNLMENPQRLQVQTIDSFCASLNRRLPYLSGLGCEANTTEQPAVLYQKAAQQTLALLDSGESNWVAAIEILLLHLDGNRNRAEKLLADMLARREQWLRHLHHGENDYSYFRLHLQQSLQELVTEELAEKASLLDAEEIIELQTLCQYAYENMPADENFLTTFKGQLPTELNLETYPQWQEVCRWLLVKKGDKLRSTMNKKQGIPPLNTATDEQQKETYKLMKGRVNALLEQFIAKQSFFIELSQLPPVNYDQQQWQLVEALMNCLKLATGLLRVIFAQSGEIDYQEVSLRALQALGEDEQPTDLTLALDYQLKHILIDEFQDTSHGQFKLLEKLLRGWQPDDGRSLFLVGDPMQSIYRFRKADVGLFLKIRQEGIADIHPHALQLTVNFRSTNNLVNWVNQQFKDILPQQENISHGAVCYAPSDAFDNSDSGAVEVYSHFNDKGHLEAQTLVTLIAEHLKTSPDQSLAVLVNTRSQLGKIMPALQTAGIKFKATEIEALGHCPVISDLQMLTRALADPGDRIAWLALLRAPFCGLVLADLLLIADTKSSSVMVNCQSDQLIRQLSADGRQRLNTLVQKILPWAVTSHRNSIRRQVEGCWLAIDGPAYVDNDIDLQATELFFDLLSSLELGGCLKDPQQLQQQLSQLYAPVATDNTINLELMTIHKSKGLEFDTVILPALNATPRHDEHTLLRWMEVSLKNSSGLLIAPIYAHRDQPDPVYSYLTLIAKKQDRYEAGRKLYVACTRARKRLILTATLAPNSKEQLVAKNSSQLQLLWPAVETDITTEFERYLASTHDDQQPVSELQDYRLCRVSNGQAFSSEQLLRDQLTYQISSSPSEKQSIEYTASAMTRHVGILTHSWLEQIADNLEQWDEQKIKTQQLVIKTQLQQMGVNIFELDKAVDNVILNLLQTLSDEQGRYLLSRHQQSVSELALERLEGDEFKHYYIDRSFIDERGIRWIVDYKTSSHQGAGREDFLSMQKQYYREQLENYATLFASIESRPIKLALYFTRYQKLISWDWSGNNNNET